MAKFHCQVCGYDKDVPDSLSGRKAKCPKCRSLVVIGMEDDQCAPGTGGRAHKKPQGDDGPCALFSCPQCEFERHVPEDLVGRSARCPECGAQALITGLPSLEDDDPIPEDIALDDLPSEADLPEPAEHGDPHDLDGPDLPNLSGLDLPDLDDEDDYEDPEAEAGEKSAELMDARDLEDISGEEEPWPADSDPDDKEPVDPDDGDPADPDEEVDWDEDGSNLDEDGEAPVVETLEDASREMARKSEGKAPPIPLFAGSPVKNVLSGLATGLFTVLLALAFANLVFSPDSLEQFMPMGLGMALAGSAAVSLLFSLCSRVSYAQAAPLTSTTVLLFLMAGSIQGNMVSQGVSSDLIAPTVIAAIILATFSTGLGMYLIGRMRSGAWMRFIPVQVVGGVLAGAGALALKGAWAMAVDAPFNLETLSSMFQPGVGSRCLSGFVLGLALFVILKKWNNTLVALGVCLGFLGLAQGILAFKGIPHQSAVDMQWFFAPIESLDYLEAFSPAFVSRVHWPMIFSHAGYALALIALAASSAMVKSSRLESMQGKEIDLDLELEALGSANMVSGVAGGFPGCLSTSRSLGARAMGAAGPLCGITTALVCVAALFAAPFFTSYIPRCLATALIVYTGLTLVHRWLIAPRAEFTRAKDYGFLVLVFSVTILFGFLVGIGVGLALCLVLLAQQYSSVSVVKHRLSGATHSSNVDRAPSQEAILKQKGAEIFILRLQGFIFMATANRLLTQIQGRIKDEDLPRVRFILLDFSFVSGLDPAVATIFAKLHRLARGSGAILIFTGVPFEAAQELEDSGFKLEDPDGSSLSFMDLDHAMEWCENRILDAEDALRVAEIPFPKLLEQEAFPDPAVIPRLMKALTKVKVLAGNHVFRQGDPSDAMYFIKSGAVNIELELEERTLRLKRMGPGTVFGEMGIYSNAPRSASVVADEDTVLFRLGSGTLEQLQVDDPLLASAIHRFIVNLLAGRVFDANAKVRDLSQ